MNRLFLAAITGECCLFHLHGIKPRGYNPFTLLKQQLEIAGIKINPRKRLETFKYLEQIYIDNGMEVHKLLAKVISTLKIQKEG